jgi:hypothetical protein
LQEEIEAQKKEWELEHLKSLKEEEERAAIHSEPEDLLTIWNEDVSQVKNRSNRSRQSLKSKCKPNISSDSKRRTSTSKVVRPNAKSKGKDKSDSNYEPAKRSNRSRPSLNYAQINQGTDSPVSPRSRPALNIESPTRPAKRRSVRTPIKSSSNSSPARPLRRSRRTSG